MYFLVQLLSIAVSLITLFAAGLWFVDSYLYIDDGTQYVYPVLSDAMQRQGIRVSD